MPFNNDILFVPSAGETEGLGNATHMEKSKVVEVDGVFIGAAVLLPNNKGWRFVAAHTRAQNADGMTAPTLHDAQMAAKRAFMTSRLPEPVATGDTSAPPARDRFPR